MVYAQRLFEGSCWCGRNRQRYHRHIMLCILNGFFAMALPMEWSMCPPSPHRPLPHFAVFSDDKCAMGLRPEAMIPRRLLHSTSASVCRLLLDDCAMGLGTKAMVPPQSPLMMLFGVCCLFLDSRAMGLSTEARIPPRSPS